MCICTLKHSVRCQGFPSDYRVLFINSTIGSRILSVNCMLGTPLHPRRKKTPSQATVGFSENEVSILFCYWAAVWVWQEVKKHTHNKQRYLINSKWESRMEGASVRWQGTVRKDTVVFRIFLREWEKPEPYFCQPSMRIILKLFSLVYVIMCW